MADLVIVAGNERALTTLAGFFGNEGYETAGYDGLTSFAEDFGRKERKPTVVLATYDRGIGEVDEIARMLKGYPTRFVLLTPAQHRDHAVGVLAAGAFGFVLEPVNILELKTVIGRAFERSELAMRHLVYDVLGALERAIAVTSRGGGIIYANPSFARLFNRSSRELIGQPISELAGEDIGKLIVQAESSKARLALREIKRGERRLAVRVSIIADAADKPSGQLVSIRPLESAGGGGESSAVDGFAEELASDVARAREQVPDLLVRQAKRVGQMYAALCELERPVKADPISLLVNELVEVAAGRAKGLLEVAADIRLNLLPGARRLACRRKLVQVALCQMMLSGLRAAPELPLTVTVGLEDDQLTVTMKDGGPPFEAGDVLFAPDPRASGADARRGELFLHFASRLLRHHDMELVPLPGQRSMQARLGPPSPE